MNLSLIKRKMFFYLLIILFSSQISYSQIDTLWTKTFGGADQQVAKCVKQTYDKGFVILSSTTSNFELTKTDSLGQIIWVKSYANDILRSMQVTSDSGFVIFGNKNHNMALLIKTDQYGDTLWTKTFFEEYLGYKVIQCKDGGYILLGVVTKYEPDCELWLTKIDKSGELEWSRNTFVPLMSDKGQQIIENKQGFFIATTDVGALFFTQTDTLGNQLWQKRYSDPTISSQSINSVIIANNDFPDSGYVLTGEQMGNLMLLRVDIGGNVLWSKQYERFTSSINTGNSIIQDYDGGYLIVGGTEDNGNNKHLFLVKTDKNGTKKYEKSYEHSYGISVDYTSDKGFIICGNKDNKIWLLKFRTAPQSIVTGDSVWIDENWNGYATNLLDASSSSSPSGFAIASYEWTNTNEVVGTETTLEIELPIGNNTIQLKVTDENGLSSSTDFNVQVCSYKLVTDGPINSSISTIGDSVFFASSTDDQVYCFNDKNVLKWQLATGGNIQSTTTIGPRKNIYVGSDDTRLYCFDPLGNFKWDIPMGGMVTASPAITQNGTIYVGTKNNRLYSVNSDGGTINWNYLTNGAITSSASISTGGDVYFGSADKSFYSVNIDGNLNWSYTTNGEIHSSPAIDTLGRIYFGSNDGKLYVLNSTGSLEWEFETGGAILSSPVIDVFGNVYFGSGDGSFYALDRNGNKLWEYSIGSPPNGNPSLTASGNIIFGCEDGKIISLNANGELNWFYKTESTVKAAPLVTSSGRIYLGSNDKSIYGFIDPNEILNKNNSALHQWSTFQKDNKRTGSQVGIQTSIKNNNESEIPDKFHLVQNYPNPFNPSTVIRYQLPELAQIEINIFNVAGEKIKSFAKEQNSAGSYSVIWNGLNDNLQMVGSGVYILQFKALSKNNTFMKSMKMMFLK